MDNAQGQNAAAGLLGDGSQILSAPRRYYQATITNKRTVKRHFSCNTLTAKFPIKSQGFPGSEYVELKV